MIKLLRSTAQLTLGLCCGLLIGGSAQAAIIDIDNVELGKLMAKGVPVIDIRTSPEWQQTGIIPGSHLLTFFDEQGQAFVFIGALFFIFKRADKAVFCISKRR